jgi:hypothetical protein
MDFFPAQTRKSGVLATCSPRVYTYNRSRFILLPEEVAMKKNLKSIGAVLAGFITIVVLSIGTDLGLEATGVFPSFADQAAHGFTTQWMLALAFFYRSLYTVAGGYVAAALAPDRPMRHAVILGIIGIAAGTLGALANWDKTTEATTWYPIALVVAGLPCTWLGGKVKTG